MARLQKLKLPKGVEIDEVSNDNLFTHPSARSVPTTLAVKDYLADEIDKHDQAFWPDGLHRNAIINGNFDIWQRGTSFSANGYTADRWHWYQTTSGSSTISRQAFDTGQQDVPHDPQYYLRISVTEGSPIESLLEQRIEDVRSFAGREVTLSFYMRGTPTQVRIVCWQRFGSGGSSPTLALNQYIPVTQYWNHYVIPIQLPSVSGKTIGSGSHLSIMLPNIGTQTGQFDIAQVQLNLGNKPLPFSPRPYAEELALCQRYYRTWTQQTENGRIHVPLWPPMRVAPTMTASAGTISNITEAGFNLTHNARVATTITASSEL